MRILRTIGLATLAVILIVAWSDAANTKRRAPALKRMAAPAADTKITTDSKSALDVAATAQPAEEPSPSGSSTSGQSATAPVSAQKQVPSNLDGETVDEPVSLPDTLQKPAEATAYELQWQAVGSGGTSATSATYEMSSTLGQAAIGESSGAGDTIQAGYQYGAFAYVIGVCPCDCHADPQCDGVTNVLDVVLAVNVAFRGATAVTDPGCGYERTDVDCSGFTNVIDVVKFVNVAFRGGDPVVNFCDPCV